MASQTTARLEQFFAVRFVALLLRGNFAVKAVLPKIRSDCFQIVVAVFVDLEAPECRHLRAGTKCLRIFQPERNPILAQLQPDVFEIRSDLFLILLQVTSLQIQFIDARRQLTALDPERFSVCEQPLHLCIISRIGAGVGVDPRLPIIRDDLLLQL